MASTMGSPTRSTTYATLRGVLAGIFISYLFSVVFPTSPSIACDRNLYSKEGDAEGHAEHEEGPRELVEAAAIVCIIILLILMTISFEEIKEHIEESADKTMRPIIESLFGEMTILGFLSVFTFVLVQSGVFEKLSIALFGHEEEELLVEIFEEVHYALFFIMIIFVSQVLILVSQGKASQRQWKKMERNCKDAAYIDKIKINPEGKEDEDQILFYALREEFIKERSADPPFLPAPDDKRVPDDFNFGRYLSISFGKIASKVVHVHVTCWAFFIIVSIVFFVIMVAVDFNIQVSEPNGLESAITKYQSKLSDFLFYLFQGSCLGMGRHWLGCILFRIHL